MCYLVVLMTDHIGGKIGKSIVQIIRNTSKLLVELAIGASANAKVL